MSLSDNGFSSGLAKVAAGFADEAGGAPTLAEFLEVLGWAVPANSDAVGPGFPQPLRFKANLKGNKRYASDAPSRVGELNDHVFEEARELAAAVAENLPEPMTPQQYADAVLEALHTGEIQLADVAGDQVRKLAADTSGTLKIKLTPGDVLAIPVRDGHRLAVVITRNRFGTALGLFDGIAPQGRPGGEVLRSPRKYPVYTEESLVKDGTWRVVGHDESLLRLFPAEPEIFHEPGAWPGIDTGEFGAAETATGPLRLISADEAREVGLSDRTYRQTYTAAHLQKVLDAQHRE